MTSYPLPQHTPLPPLPSRVRYAPGDEGKGDGDPDEDDDEDGLTLDATLQQKLVLLGDDADGVKRLDAPTVLVGVAAE